MLLNKALLDGFILSMILFGWIAFILKVNPRYEMKSYPPDIIKCVNPQTKKEKKSFLTMALPMSILVTIFLIFSISSTYKSYDVSYWILFLHTFIVFSVWNVFDLVIFDWLIFCTITPKFIILPETDGHIAYKDYYFHFIGFLKGLLFTAVGAIIISGIVFLIIKI